MKRLLLALAGSAALVAGSVAALYALELLRIEHAQDGTD